MIAANKEQAMIMICTLEVFKFRVKNTPEATFLRETTERVIKEIDDYIQEIISEAF